MFRLAFCVCVGITLLVGCAPAPVKMYDGPERVASEHVVVSSIGLYPEKKTAVLIKKINGEQPPNITHAAEYLLLPGEYLFSLHVRNDQQYSQGQLTWKEADVDVKLKADAGHTYIPNAVIVGDKVRAFFDDKGLNYRRDCLPLYTQALIYGTGKSDCN